jgi:predicted MFS family arabinose efflux permease
VNTTNVSQGPGYTATPSLPASPTAADEWRSGWPLVFSSFFVMTMVAIPTSTLGLFVAPLQEAFAWSRATITSAALTNALCVLLLSPFVGRVIGRYGARSVGLAGILATGAAIASIGTTGPSVASWYVAWILVGITQTFAGPIIWSSALVRKFNVSRGLGLAVTLSGTALATAIVAPLALLTMTAWGWRATFFVLGGGAIAVCFPLIWWMFRGPATGPVARPAATVRAQPGAGGTPTGRWGEGWRSWRFAKLAWCCFGVALALSALFVHMVPILRDRGMSASDAVTIVSVVGVVQLIARLLGGHLLDRFFAPYIGICMFMLIAAACLILVNVPTTFAVAVVVGLLTGAGLGLELDLMAYLTSRYFNTRDYATCYGLLLGLYGIGFGGGALLAGAMFDRYGSYDLTLMAMTVVLVTGGLAMAALGRFPVLEAEDLSAR